MSVGSWDRSQITQVGPTIASWNGVKHTRSWNGLDRQLKVYPKASLVSVDRAQAIFDDLDDENKARHHILAKATRREARRLNVNAGLAQSGQGFFFYKKDGKSKLPKREYSQDNNYTMSERYDSEWPCFYRGPNAPYPVTFAQSQMSTFGATTWLARDLLGANDQLKLIKKLGEKMRGSDFNAGVFLAESNEAIGLIGDTAIRVAKAHHHLRRGDLAGTARAIFERTSRTPIKSYQSMRPFRPTAERMSSHWLELQYGWLPLLNEAHSAAEFVAHQLSVPLKKKYKASIRVEMRTRNNWVSGYTPYKIFGDSTLTHKRWLTAVFREKSPYLGTMVQLDPATVAWELLPYSFAADWFIPFGSWLEARSLASSLNCDYHVIANKRTGERYAPYGPGIVGDRIPARSFDVTFSRQVIAGNPQVPPPRFVPLSKALSVRRCLSAISLVTQQVFGGKTFSRPIGN